MVGWRGRGAAREVYPAGGRLGSGDHGGRGGVGGEGGDHGVVAGVEVVGAERGAHAGSLLHLGPFQLLPLLLVRVLVAAERLGIGKLPTAVLALVLPAIVVAVVVV